MRALVLLSAVLLSGCFHQSPTGGNAPAALALQLYVAHWDLLAPAASQTLARHLAGAQISRVEIYVASAQDTLAHTSVMLEPGAVEFSASLEVPAGDQRKIIVEAWDDVGGEGTSSLTLRGVQTNITIVPETMQTVALTLYPVPISGRRVVLALGPGAGTPGSQGNLVPVTLASAEALSGVQFDLNFNAAIISPQRVYAAAALPWHSVESSLVNNGQSLRVLMFGADGARLPAVYDPARLAEVEASVSGNAAVGARSALTISNALVLDAAGNALEVAAVQDTFYVRSGS